MDLRSAVARITVMRFLAAVVALAAVLVPAAFAKGQLRVHLADTTPRVGQRVAVTVRTDYVVPPADWLRLVVVPPAKSWYAYAGRDGIRMTRSSPKTWRAVVRFGRPGLWRVVIPNGTHVGYMVPPPAAWMPWVHVHR
jgi:hypothetical protein